MKKLPGVSLFIVCLSLFYLPSEAVKVVSFNEVDKLLQTKNDTTYFVNFWATWCIPCRKEIPHIEKIKEKYKDEKLSIILISLDFPSQLESSLKPYIKKNEIKSEIWLLDESNPNSWINKVNPKWSGAIPASVVYNKNTYEFYEKSFDYEELKSIISTKLIH